MSGEAGIAAPRPLSGVRVVVTRARAQAGGLADALAALGADVVLFPTIRIVPPGDPEPIRRAAAQVSTFDWVVFTSVNAVERFWGERAGAGGDAAGVSGVRVCAIGRSTAAELARRGVRVDLVPGEFVSEAVVDALLGADHLQGRRILLPRAAGARALLPDALRRAGAEVTDVEAYRTVPDGEGADEVRRLLAAGAVDLVTFTSGSTVRAFLDLVGGTGRARVACIGPVTAGVARERGLAVDLEARKHTTEGLVEAIRGWYVENRDRC